MARHFSSLKRIDYRNMRRLIQLRTYDGSRTTLGQLVQGIKLQTGVVELLGYVQIAHDDGHSIDKSRTESVKVKLNRSLSTNLRRMEDLKFVRQFEHEPPSWEIRRIIKARLPLEELEQLQQVLIQEVSKLSNYNESQTEKDESIDQ